MRSWFVVCTPSCDGSPPSLRRGMSTPTTCSTARWSAPVPPQELDPAGLELQAEILADDKVTREEYEQALEGWKDCMENHGMVDVSFEIEPLEHPAGAKGARMVAGADHSRVRCA